MSRTSKTRSVSSRVGGFMRGVREIIPAAIPAVLKRSWKFTQKQSKEFAKHLKNPQEKEEKFIEAVIRKFRG